MCSIFVSYRRTDSSGHAGRLYDRLAKRFGSVSVFMDTETVRPGSDWPETIQSVLKTCNVVIVIIGRNWVSALRLRNTRKKIDPVHFEVAEALKTPGIVVIPVLVMGASMPSEADLPEDLSALTRQQALHLHDDQFSYSCKVLFQEIEPALSTIKGVRPTTRSRHIGTPNIVVADLKDLLALGWSVRKIIDELLALEYAMSPELTLEFSGTSDQWIPILEAHPETWRVLLNEERRIIANWHFVALGSADFKRAQTGRLLESEISADMVRHIDITGFYNIYFVAAFIAPQSRQLHTLRLFRTSILDHFLFLAREGVFIDMVCANAYSKPGEAFCNSFGLPPGKHHNHGGRICERTLFPLPASLKYSRAKELNALYRRARKSRISPKNNGAN